MIDLTTVPAFPDGGVLLTPANPVSADNKLLRNIIIGVSILTVGYLIYLSIQKNTKKFITNNNS
jgi:hypothetical protein